VARLSQGRRRAICNQLRPKGKSEDCAIPAVASRYCRVVSRTQINLHGGGFCLPRQGSNAPFCALVASRLNCWVVVADYRMAPDRPFPAGYNDPRCVIEWVHANELAARLIQPRSRSENSVQVRIGRWLWPGVRRMGRPGGQYLNSAMDGHDWMVRRVGLGCLGAQAIYRSYCIRVPMNNTGGQQPGR